MSSPVRKTKKGSANVVIADSGASKGVTRSPSSSLVDPRIMISFIDTVVENTRTHCPEAYEAAIKSSDVETAVKSPENGDEQINPNHNKRKSCSPPQVQPQKLRRHSSRCLQIAAEPGTGLTKVAKELLNATILKLSDSDQIDFKEFLDYVAKTHTKLKMMIETAGEVPESAGLILMLGVVSVNLKNLSPFVHDGVQREHLFKFGTRIECLSAKIKEKADEMKLTTAKVVEMKMMELVGENKKLKALAEEMQAENVRIQKCADETKAEYAEIKQKTEELQAENEKRGKQIGDLETTLKSRDEEIERFKIEKNETQKNVTNIVDSFIWLKTTYVNTEEEKKTVSE